MTDLFDFDISVSADKKRRQKDRTRRGMSGAVETSSRQCERKGCTRKGQYRAPKSREQLDEFHWFCRKHVREYNLQWNFFSAPPGEEGEEESRLSPDEQRRERERIAWQRLGIEDPFEILGDRGTRNPGTGIAVGRRLSPTERRAVMILEAREDWSLTEIRTQFRIMVKTLHPDMNGGDRSEEGRLKEVVWAWEQLKGCAKFRS